jgi:hypothetical protein
VAAVADITDDQCNKVASGWPAVASPRSPMLIGTGPHTQFTLMLVLDCAHTPQARSTHGHDARPQAPLEFEEQGCPDAVAEASMFTATDKCQ